MRYFILTLLLSFTFSECDELTEMQCASNADCEWFEDIEYGNCSWFDQDHDACEETPGCYGAYQYPGWYSGWYCAGGQFTIDNGYCQESSLPPLSCEDTNQTEYLIECNGGYMMSDVSWLLNPGDTMGGAPYAQYICLSDDDYQLTMADDGWNGWNGNTWSLYKADMDGMEIHGDLVAQCTLDSGGIDDCFFTIGTPAPPESCEESNQTECENDDTCQWINNTTIGDCGDFLSQQDCDSSIFCFWGNGGGGSCFGGIYEEDNSYCQENPNPPTCSEMNELQCGSSPDCEWITTYQWYNCNNFQNYTQCNNYSEYGCYWYDHWYYSGWDSCNGPSFQVENGGYCQNNPDYMQGDLNGDLILNILDVIIIVDIILNQESSDLADINGDGIVNILDVIELVDIIINR